jgi:cytochrome P450
MEITDKMLFSPAVTLVGTLSVAFLVVRYFAQLHHHRKQSKALHCKPARSGSSGFFGIPGFIRLSKAVREKRWIEHLYNEYAVYGNTYKQTFLSRNLITTIEPENVKAILATRFKDFSLGTRHQQFYPLLGDGIFTLDGAGWSHARGLLRPQFTRDQVNFPICRIARHFIDTRYRSPIFLCWMTTSPT